MTVAELIRFLQSQDSDLQVYFAHPSHDYWRTEIASPVNQVGEEALQYSAYHSQMATLSEDEQDEAEARGKETKHAVILR